MTPAPSASSARAGLSAPAQLYLLAVYGAAVAVYAFEITNAPAFDAHDWRLAVLLAGAAAVAQLFNVVTTRNTSYHATPVVVVAAALLLPPPLLALVAVVQHIPEWLKVRYPWYIQCFNIANYGLSALAARRAFDLVSSGDAVIPNADLRFIVAGLAAAGVFMFVQHLVLALVLRLGRGHSIRDSGLFSVQSLSTDLVLSLLGVVIVALWPVNPWAAVFVLAPLVLIHRTLAMPKLEAEAREDPKTGLFNARHFTEVLEEAVERASRVGRPASLLVADLDLLREINNRYGHLAGDAVLAGVARAFQTQLRPGDVAARFGGEEFSLLLPDTTPEEAVAIAERIRTAIAGEGFVVETSSEPISATVSIGVASFPAHASDARDLIHRADIAAYRAKAQGRNRVVQASESGAVDELVVTGPHAPAPRPLASATSTPIAPRPVMPARPPTPNYLSLSRALRSVVAMVGIAGIGAGLAAFVLGANTDPVGLLVLVGLVAIGQALAVEVLDHGSISLSAVGSLAGAALFGPRVALVLAVAVCAVDWSARRGQLYTTFFNCGALVLSSLAAAAVFGALPSDHWLFVAGGVAAGAVYYAVNVGLLASVIALETNENWLKTLRERFSWLFLHYLVYGVIAAMIALAYVILGVISLLVFAVPLILVRKAQLDYIEHTEANVRRLRDAAETIEQQNESLTQANTLLRERATEAMESLAAAIDARDAYTAGHSRRVQDLSVAIGRQLGLDGAELESLSFAALFHDVGKLAVPDEILLKSGPLDDDDWWIVRRHPEEGARIIGHLGFLADAAPSIKHHHERWDGTGYPDGLRGDEIPLGARILHVSDAFDSMVTTRVYRVALPLPEALAELRQGSGSQFCPRCVAALETLAANGTLDRLLPTALHPAVA
jgi:diguanylate cyclase (GGDEF)-like protein